MAFESAWQRLSSCVSSSARLTASAGFTAGRTDAAGQGRGTFTRSLGPGLLSHARPSRSPSSWFGSRGSARKHRLCVGLTLEVRAVVAVALPDVLRRVEPAPGRWCGCPDGNNRCRAVVRGVAARRPRCRLAASCRLRTSPVTTGQAGCPSPRPVHPCSRRNCSRTASAGVRSWYPTHRLVPLCFALTRSETRSSASWRRTREAITRRADDRDVGSLWS